MWLIWKSRQSACSHLSKLAISGTFLKYDWFERSSQLVQVCFITCVAFLQHDTLKTLTERFVAFILLLQIRCRGKNFNNEKFVFFLWLREKRTPESHWEHKTLRGTGTPSTIIFCWSRTYVHHVCPFIWDSNHSDIFIFSTMKRSFCYTPNFHTHLF